MNRFDDFIKSEADVVRILNQIEAFKKKNLAENIRGGIKDTKTAKIFDLKGQKLDPNQPIIGGTQPGKSIDTDTNQIIKKITSMEPVEAMKEANNVIKREGIYKNLNEKEAKKILKDTEDWIFQRDPDDLYDYKNKRPFRDDPDYDPENMATGGRAGFKMGRRAFLKLMGGIGAGIGALKTGLLKLTGKEAAPQVVKEVVEQTTKSTPPPYFFELANKIKILGTPGKPTMARQEVHNYKNYELVEDKATGDIRITIEKGDPERIGGNDGYRQEVLEYKKGDVDVVDEGLETQRGVRTPDEYEEATIYPEPDTGRLKDIEDGVDENTIKEIIEEVSEGGGNVDEVTLQKIKKGEQGLAGGGIADMVNKRFDFDSGGSPLQRLRQALVDDLMAKVPGIPEADLQIIVKDINLDMSPEEAQASVKANFLQLYGKAQGGLAGMLGE